MVLDLTVTS